MGWWWVLNAGLGEALWPFSFTLQWGNLWPSAFLLLFIVATGALLHRRMGIGASPLSDARKAPAPSVSLLELAVIHSGVSIYVGWTTAATILNFSIALSASGVTANAVEWAQAVVAAAAVLAVTAAATRTDFLFAATLCWALSGIHANQTRLALPASTAQASQAAAAVAGIAAAVATAVRAWMYATGRLVLAPSSLQLGSSDENSDDDEGGGGGGDAYRAAPEVVVVVNALVAGGVEWGTSALVTNPVVELK